MQIISSGRWSLNKTTYIQYYFRYASNTLIYQHSKVTKESVKSFKRKDNELDVSRYKIIKILIDKKEL